MFVIKTNVSRCGLSIEVAIGFSHGKHMKNTEPNNQGGIFVLDKYACFEKQLPIETTILHVL